MPPKNVRRTPYLPLPPILAAASLGILTDKLVHVPAAIWTLCFAAFCLLWTFRYKKRKQFSSTLLLLSVCFALFGLYHHYRWNSFAKNEIGFYVPKEGTPAALRGTVNEMPRYLPPTPQTDSFFPPSPRTRFTLNAAQLRDGSQWISVTGKVAVITDGDLQDLHIGDTLQLFGHLSQPLEPQNPGDYDYAAALRSERILCVLRCSSADSVSVTKTGRFGLSRLLEHIRRAGAARLQQNMPPETAALASAMILGIRDGVDDETTQELIETGTLHILAISGLHIGLVALCAAFLLEWFGVSRRKTAVVLIVTVIVYLFITDVRPPAIRAVMMVAVVSAALYSGRMSSSLNTLAAAALTVLLINPTELFRFGTQLSFLATSAFFWVPRSVQLFPYDNAADNNTDWRQLEIFDSRRPLFAVIFFGFCKKLLQLFAAGLVIWLITMPLLLAQVHLFTPIAVAVNPLLWLLLTPAMVSGFTVLLFGSVPYLGSLLGATADLSFQLLFGTISFFRDCGGHYWVPGPPDWWNIVLYTVFAILTFFPLQYTEAGRAIAFGSEASPPRWAASGFAGIISKRTIIYLLLLFVWIAVLFCSFYTVRWIRHHQDRLTLSLFSVGHGNCTLIITPHNETVLYDAGCISSPLKAADVMSNALWRLGKTKIDTVILSHPDSDHINGIFLLAERFTIGRILISPYFFEPLKRMEAELQKRNINADELVGTEFQDGKLLYAFRQLIMQRRIVLQTIGQGDTLDEYGLPNSRVLHPPKEGFREADKSNAACLVIHFEHRQTGVLLTGDLDSQQRLAFLEEEAMPCRTMTVPHHGGKSNQTETLLKWSQPKTLLISAGRFTHRDETIDAFRQKGYEVRSTFLEGAITISF